MRTLAMVVVAVLGAAGLIVAGQGDARKQYAPAVKAQPRPLPTEDFDQDRHDALAEIDQQYAEQDQEFAEMDQAFAVRDQEFAQLDQELSQQDQKLAEIDQKFAEIDQEFAERDQERTGRDQEQAQQDHEEPGAAVALEPDRVPGPTVPKQGVWKPEK